MAHHRFLIILASLGMLGACSDGEERSGDAANDNGTTMTISSGDGNSVISADGGSGKVKLDLPFLKGEMTVPNMEIAADDVDIDGVALYPGSRVTNIDVRGGKSEDDDGMVDIAFEAPQKPDVVRSYFVDAFKARGMKASVQGSAIDGTDKEGKPFRIELAEGGAGTKGSIRFTKVSTDDSVE